ncbi:hypothetical protein C8F04DRAFT_1197986 [Mycena alexandri]|uniref:Uncharacterized protein n=1 Tax=Mycena alexandri TaxID=1745969 RepID=A0AAD6S0V0_9AGAR|nr:hypothetical protein C8F04DRAFT_1197986 [Mycena alexandri]
MYVMIHACFIIILQKVIKLIKEITLLAVHTALTLIIPGFFDWRFVFQVMVSRNHYGAKHRLKLTRGQSAAGQILSYLKKKSYLGFVDSSGNCARLGIIDEIVIWVNLLMPPGGSNSALVQDISPRISLMIAQHSHMLAKKKFTLCNTCTPPKFPQVGSTRGAQPVDGRNNPGPQPVSSQCPAERFSHIPSLLTPEFHT